ncbi:MAG TPA: amino acid permease, partial [Myxococcales bacterium]|nr:amino acid permease [Myxococcales bacterium]
IYLVGHPQVAARPVEAGLDGWLKAMLLLLFAYGGYEAALNPMGEARNPQRDVAFALFTALAILLALYALLQLIVIDLVPDAAHSVRPLADAARVAMGPAGAALISVGALLSVYGYISANMLTVPRSTFALAERGDFPAWLAAVHPRFRTPHFSILVFALLLWGFSQFASFAWNVTLSAVARVLFYGGICAAVPVLRRRQPGAAVYRLPGGLLLPLVGTAICALLLTRADFSKSLILLATLTAAAVNWLLVRNPRRAAAISKA